MTTQPQPPVNPGLPTGWNSIATPAPKKRRKLPWILGGVAVLAVAIVAVVALAFGGGFEAKGTFTLYDGPARIGQACHGDGGFSDIAPGAAVVVTDAAGKTLAIGRLGASTGITAFECRFDFSVPDVPGGEDFYAIEVSRRGAVRFTEDQMHAPLRLELGDR